MKALIFAAGLGLRLRPLTLYRPKALVEVGGKPLLEWLLEKLSASGFRDIVINVHYLGEQIKEFALKKAEALGVRVVFSEEFDLLRDTGGGIRHARYLLEDGEPILVHNADIVSSLDLRQFYSRAKALQASDNKLLANVVVSPRQSTRRLLFEKESMLLRGWINLQSGQRKPVSLQEADIKRLSPYAFAGIHILSPRIFPLMEKEGEKFSIIDFYLKYAEQYNIVGDVQPDLHLVDVGLPDHLIAAEELVKKYYK